MKGISEARLSTDAGPAASGTAIADTDPHTIWDEDDDARTDPTRVFALNSMPREVQISYWIWVVGGMLGVLVGLATCLAALPFITILDPAGRLGVVLNAAAVAFAGAQIVLALAMKQRKEWARIVLTALCAAGVVLTAAIDLGGLPAGNWLALALTVAATVLLWVPASREWFADEPS